MDVVVEAPSDRADAVVVDLVRVQLLPFNNRLQFLRNNEVAALHVPTARVEIGETRRFPSHRATIDILREVLADQIEWPDIYPSVQTPRRPFIRPGKGKWGERTIGIYFEVQCLRDVCARIVPAIQNIAAKFQARLLA